MVNTDTTQQEDIVIELSAPSVRSRETTRVLAVQEDYPVEGASELVAQGQESSQHQEACIIYYSILLCTIHSTSFFSLLYSNPFHVLLFSFPLVLYLLLPCSSTRPSTPDTSTPFFPFFLAPSTYHSAYLMFLPGTSSVSLYPSSLSLFELFSLLSAVSSTCLLLFCSLLYILLLFL